MIKRSMTVRPSPIVVEMARIRLPHPSEYDDAEYDWRGEWGYRITRVTNSTDYRPGFLLTRGDVDSLIADSWTVTVLSK